MFPFIWLNDFRSDVYAVSNTIILIYGVFCQFDVRVCVEVLEKLEGVENLTSFRCARVVKCGAHLCNYKCIFMAKCIEQR